MKHSPPHVTDHALVRYLERVRGFTFERERAEIRRICNGLGDSKKATVRSNNCLFEVRNGSVVTITPPGNGPSKTKRAEIEERA